MLNWRRDPDYEMRMTAKLIEIEQIKKEPSTLGARTSGSPS